MIRFNLIGYVNIKKMIFFIDFIPWFTVPIKKNISDFGSSSGMDQIGISEHFRLFADRKLNIVTLNFARWLPGAMGGISNI